MKHTAQNGGSVLGYLAAFTLGVVCLGTVVLVTRDKPQTNRPLVSVREPEQRSDGKRVFIRRTPPSPQRPSAELQPAAVSEIDFANTEAPNHITIPQPPPARERVPVPVPVPVPASVLVIQNSSDARHRDAVAATIVKKSARLAGHVYLVGDPPPEKILPLDPTCAAGYKTPPTTRFYLKAQNGGLADVVVSIVKLHSGKASSSRPPLELQLKGCSFDRYVSGILTGQRVTVKNFDRVLHAVRISGENKGEATPPLFPGREISHVFRRPEEFVRFSCDIHPWEFAYVSVFDTPDFAISDATGAYEVGELPPGKYKIRATHRKAGTIEKEIVLEAGRDEAVDFTFHVPVPLQAMN